MNDTQAFAAQVVISLMQEQIKSLNITRASVIMCGAAFGEQQRAQIVARVEHALLQMREAVVVAEQGPII